MKRILPILLFCSLLLFGCGDIEKEDQKVSANTSNETNLSEENYVSIVKSLESIKDFNSHAFVFMERLTLDTSLIHNEKFKDEYFDIFKGKMYELENVSLDIENEKELEGYLNDYISMNKELVDALIKMIENEDITYTSVVTETFRKWELKKKVMGIS